jgi:Domain of unknown function (DUF1707)/Cell wall-active antibiotics response 4TMS YvqF
MPDDSPDPAAHALTMRASDADRERVAEVLRDAYVDGRLSPSEHEERLSAAYTAATFGELVPVLTDLPVPPGTLPVPESRGVELVTQSSASPAPAFHSSASLALSVRPDLAAQADGDAVAVFGSFERRGRWVVPPWLKAVCVFGGGELDFTQAQLTSQVTVLKVRCIFGGLDITVPEGLAVQNGVTAVFGGHSNPATDAPHGAPVLRIEGTAVFGGIDTHRPRRSISK